MIVHQSVSQRNLNKIKPPDLTGLPLDSLPFTLNLVEHQDAADFYLKFAQVIVAEEK